MHIVDTLDTLKLLQTKAVVVLYGGASCGVCSALRPKIAELLTSDFPQMHFAYVDCQGSAQNLCAQHGVFSLPVVQIWFNNQKFAEFYQVFAMSQLREALARPYALHFHTTP